VTIKQIVVPLDGLTANDRAIDVAVMLARRANATVELMSVVSAGLEDSDLTEMEAIASRQDVVSAARAITETDSIETSLLAEVAGPERLLCIASAGHGAIAELLDGSVSENIIRRSTEPVVAVGPHAETRPDATMLAVALDGSSTSEAILPAAQEMAAQLGLSLVLLGVHPPLGGGRNTSGNVERYDNNYLASVARRIDPGRQTVNWEVLHDSKIVHALADYTSRNEVALIATATHAPGYVERLFLGGITFNLIKHARCPVLTWHEPVEATRTITYRTVASGAKVPTGGRVVVGVDADDPEPLVLWASDYASARNAELQIVHAWQMPYEEMPGTIVVPMAPLDERNARMDAIAQRAAAVALAAHPDLAVEALITTAEPPAEALLHVAEGAELLVVGRHDRSRVGELVFGSVATACVRHSPCPIVTVPLTKTCSKEDSNEGS
jgi:nucleotide-binding universal stress UspA family protein